MAKDTYMYIVKQYTFEGETRLFFKEWEDIRQQLNDSNDFIHDDKGNSIQKGDITNVHYVKRVDYDKEPEGKEELEGEDE